MSDVQFIKLGDNYDTFWIFDKVYGQHHAIRKAWYDLKHRGEKIRADELIFMAAQTFVVYELFCAGFECGKKIFEDYINAEKRKKKKI